jgi:hypothetical protein
MAFNDRTPTPLDPAADPDLPIADSSQGHDIPTGVAPSLAKLQDWTAWIRENAVFYFAPGIIANDIQIGGNLVVTGTADIAGDVDMGGSLDVGTSITGASLTTTGALSGSSLALTGTQPASTANPGANTLHSTNIAKAWAYAQTNGSGGVAVNDGFNIASVAVTGLSLRFTFARAFSSSSYCVQAVCGNTASFVVVESMTATYVDISVYSAASAGTINPASNFVYVHLLIMGRH